MDDGFVVMAPPLGQVQDEHSCIQGLRNIYAKDDITLNILKGAVVEQMNIEKFTKFCKEYKNRNFVSTDEILQFVPLDMISNDTTKFFAEIFTDCLSERRGLRAIVSKLDSRKYYPGLHSANRELTGN